MSNSLEFISTHPIIAFIVMCFHLTISFALYEFQLPIIIMQLFQLVACTITITVGLITISKFIKPENKK